jgi:thymidine phosphorylase
MGGANHVLIDIPLGPSAKVRTLAEAERLGGLFHAVSDQIDLRSMLKSPTRTRP